MVMSKATDTVSREILELLYEQGGSMRKATREIKAKYQNNVLMMRLKAGYKTQKEFAQRIRISPTTLCDLESNRQFLSSAYALRIAEVLGCSLDDLFEKRK